MLVNNDPVIVIVTLLVVIVGLRTPAEVQDSC